MDLSLASSVNCIYFHLGDKIHQICTLYAGLDTSTCLGQVKFHVGQVKDQNIKIYLPSRSNFDHQMRKAIKCQKTLPECKQNMCEILCSVSLILNFFIILPILLHFLCLVWKLEFKTSTMCHVSTCSTQ